MNSAKFWTHENARNLVEANGYCVAQTIWNEYEDGEQPDFEFPIPGTFQSIPVYQLYWVCQLNEYGEYEPVYFAGRDILEATSAFTWAATNHPVMHQLSFWGAA